ncbi:MAG TPA: hypothetical protein VF468_13630, partial [Actinomycetota bacterium]|nr:hypothetical protein [Actinomycetota bacterium]
NVVLGPDGPRVVDFGIARYDGAASITQTGARVGTPSWMAPEQLHDRPDLDGVRRRGDGDGGHGPGSGRRGVAGGRRL